MVDLPIIPLSFFDYYAWMICKIHQTPSHQTFLPSKHKITVMSVVTMVSVDISEFTQDTKEIAPKHPGGKTIPTNFPSCTARVSHHMVTILLSHAYSMISILYIHVFVTTNHTAFLPDLYCIQKTFKRAL